MCCACARVQSVFVSELVEVVVVVAAAAVAGWYVHIYTYISMQTWRTGSISSK